MDDDFTFDDNGGGTRDEEPVEEEGYEEQQIQGGQQDIKPDIKRAYMTRHQIASWNLYKELKNYPEISNNRRESLRNEFLSFPSLPILNMKVFAAVLVFLILVDNNVIKTTLSSDIFMSLANQLKNQLSDTHISDYITKTQATFLRYGFSILNFRASKSNQ